MCPHLPACLRSPDERVANAAIGLLEKLCKQCREVRSDRMSMAAVLIQEVLPPLIGRLQPTALHGPRGEQVLRSLSQALSMKEVVAQLRAGGRPSRRVSRRLVRCLAALSAGNSGQGHSEESGTEAKGAAAAPASPGKGSESAAIGARASHSEGAGEELEGDPASATTAGSGAAQGGASAGGAAAVAEDDESSDDETLQHWKSVRNADPSFSQPSSGASSVAGAGSEDKDDSMAETSPPGPADSEDAEARQQSLSDDEETRAKLLLGCLEHLCDGVDALHDGVGPSSPPGKPASSDSNKSLVASTSSPATPAGSAPPKRVVICGTLVVSRLISRF